MSYVIKDADGAPIKMRVVFIHAIFCEILLDAKGITSILESTWPESLLLHF